MLKQSLTEKSTYWLKVISLGLILGLGIQFAEAWTPPTLSPPSSTISGPITNGNVPQYKAGMLGVNSVTAPINALEVGLGGNVLVGGGVYTAGSINATSGTVTGVLTAGKVQIVDVVIENSSCETGVVVGTVARDSNGVLLSCQGPGDLQWKKATGGGGTTTDLGSTTDSSLSPTVCQIEPMINSTYTLNDQTYTQTSSAGHYNVSVKKVGSDYFVLVTSGVNWAVPFNSGWVRLNDNLLGASPLRGVSADVTNFIGANTVYISAYVKNTDPTRFISNGCYGKVLVQN